MSPGISLVEDDQTLCTTLREYLQSQNVGWEVYTAPSREAAVSTIRAKVQMGAPVDVILTDLFLERDRTGGFDLIREAQRIDPSIVTILYSGHAAELACLRNEAFERGAFDVIDKSWHGDGGHRELNIKTRTALRFKEHAKQVASLSRYFAPRLVEGLLSNRSALAMKERLITVCFWDVRGFTKLCDILRHRSDLVSGFLTEYCDLGARAIHDSGGVLDKFIGDGIMALFGVLRDSSSDEGEEDAVAAVKAALRLNREFPALVSEWLPRWKKATSEKLEVGLGCGIHTGRVLAGDIGVGFHHHFTALGDTVNVAARIQDFARSVPVLLSQSTCELVKTHFRTNHYKDRAVKGKSGLLPLYRVE